MEQEIVAYLRKGRIEDLFRLLDTGITEDEFYQYVGVVQITEQTNSELDDRITQVLVLVAHEWGNCITSSDVEYAKSVIGELPYIGVLPNINDEHKKFRCMLIKNCYRVLHMQHTKEHTLEEWVKQLHGYCKEIRNNNFVRYVNIDDMFFYTQEEFEEKFYRVTGVCISNLEERTRQQLYDELGMVLTRGVTEDKLKQIIGEIL